MSDPAPLDLAACAERVRAARLQWLELDTPPRRALQWRLPDWEDQMQLVQGGMEQARCTVGLVQGWRGFTAADLPDAGLPDPAAPVAFNADALQVVLADHVEWVLQLMTAVVKTTQARRKARDDALGN